MKKKILLGTLFIISFFIITGCSNNEEKGSVTTAPFTISYLGVDILPGSLFNKAAINEEYDYSEITSCAFEGKDKVYTYYDVEVTTADVDGEEKVYAVYFLSDEISTPEGVKITDDKTIMIEKYGNPDDEFGNKHSYTRNNVTLSFIVENDIITSIEYTMVVDSAE